MIPKIVSLTKDIFCKRSGTLMFAGTICVYDTERRAVYTGKKVEKSEIWIGLPDSNWKEIGWVEVKEDKDGEQ